MLTFELLIVAERALPTSTFQWQPIARLPGRNSDHTDFGAGRVVLE
jgi:hypothetical protein